MPVKTGKAKGKTVKKAKKAVKKPVRKVAPKPVKKVAAVKKPKVKRVPNPAFMKPMQPDLDLAAVVGEKPMPRTEITKKLWAYIKKNDLQDSKNRRMINADDRLKAIFAGKRQVSMFEMTKLISNHIKEA